MTSTLLPCSAITRASAIEHVDLPSAASRARQQTTRESGSSGERKARFVAQHAEGLQEALLAAPREPAPRDARHAGEHGHVQLAGEVVLAAQPVSSRSRRSARPAPRKSAKTNITAA